MTVLNVKVVLEKGNTESPTGIKPMTFHITGWNAKLWETCVLIASLKLATCCQAFVVPKSEQNNTQDCMTVTLQGSTNP